MTGTCDPERIRFDYDRTKVIDHLTGRRQVVRRPKIRIALRKYAALAGVDNPEYLLGA